MSDRRRTPRPTLPVGYQYCETRDRNVFSELMREADRLIAEDIRAYLRAGQILDTLPVPSDLEGFVCQRMGDETL